MKKRCVVYGFQSIIISLRSTMFSLFCVVIGLIKVKILFKKNQKYKLEIGAGNSMRKEGFITSDLSLKVDYPFDLRFGLPFPSDSFELIYAEHVFEHFHYLDLIAILSDCYRTLKPDGILSLVVPDAAIYLNAYHHPEKFDYKKYCLYDFGLSYKCKIDFVNYMFYMDGHHHYMFDGENILTILHDIGFKKIRLRGYDPHLDQEERKYESIYAEGIK
jgi:predicted SAM-dependent methyltransferase